MYIKKKWLGFLFCIFVLVPNIFAATIPNKPAITFKDNGQLQIITEANHEYMIEGISNWQSNNSVLTYQGLKNNETYTILYRIKDDGSGNPSFTAEYTFTYKQQKTTTMPKVTSSITTSKLELETITSASKAEPEKTDFDNLTQPVEYIEDVIANKVPIDYELFTDKEREYLTITLETYNSLTNDEKNQLKPATVYKLDNYIINFFSDFYQKNYTTDSTIINNLNNTNLPALNKLINHESVKTDIQVTSIAEKEKYQIELNEYIGGEEIVEIIDFSLAITHKEETTNILNFEQPIKFNLKIDDAMKGAKYTIYEYSNHQFLEAIQGINTDGTQYFKTHQPGIYIITKKNSAMIQTTAPIIDKKDPMESDITVSETIENIEIIKKENKNIIRPISLSILIVVLFAVFFFSRKLIR